MAAQELRISLIQSPLHWEQPAANRALFDQKLAGLKGQTDLVVLPEMFTTGFSMNAVDMAENMEGPSLEWMHRQARELEAVVTGSLIIEDKGQYYNRLLWVQPDGRQHTYDKRHLFTLAGEHRHYSGGQERLIVEYKGWKICPLICYDLRFPVWSRNTVDYDLLIYVANFPAKRSLAWKTLLQARAIENLAYTIGVNRVGTDENDIYYSGDSSLIDYEGNILFQQADEEAIFTTSLSYQAQQSFRQRFNFLADRD
ncbi:MAG: amidohydrolase [Bacteroidota bacterium]